MANSHDAHPETVLSLTQETADGGRVYQSWNICSCSVSALRARLGKPHFESTATAEAVQATARAVRDIPGSVHIGSGPTDV